MTAQQILDQEAQKLLDQILNQIRHNMKTSNRFYLPFTEGPCVVTKSVYEQLSKMGFNANYEYSVIGQKGRLEVSWQHLTPNLTTKPLIAEWD